MARANEQRGVRGVTRFLHNADGNRVRRDYVEGRFGPLSSNESQPPVPDTTPSLDTRVSVLLQHRDTGWKGLVMEQLRLVMQEPDMLDKFFEVGVVFQFHPLEGFVEVVELLVAHGVSIRWRGNIPGLRAELKRLGR